MKIIGLTGGIGSGKSTVADIFSSLGIPVFKADESGRKVLESDADVVSAVIKLIGEGAYDDGGKANRPFIASQVFNDDDKLNALNHIIHPAVGRDFKQWKSRQNHPFCIREAAILFESGTHQDCDEIICVSANEQVRIARVIKRDRVEEAAVRARMAKQWSQYKKENLSDFIIHNNGHEGLISQVISITNEIMQKG